jgi:catalase-peroxidase
MGTTFKDINDSSAKCPVMHGGMTETGTTVEWWGKGFDYREELKKLDFEASRRTCMR